MSSTSNANHDGDQAGPTAGDQPELDRHIAALRDLPTAGAPPAGTVAATLAMLGNAARPALTLAKGRIDAPPAGRRRSIERLFAMTLSQRIAAAFMLTLGALTLYFMFSLFSGLGSSVAFADVADKLKHAHTIQYTSTITRPGGPPMSIRTLAAEPNRLRSELPGGRVSILRDNTSMQIDPNAKTAVRTKFTGADEPASGKEGSLVEAMRSLGSQKGEPLGEREIDGVAVVGFRSNVGGRTLRVWADKKTAVPVRVEMTTRHGGEEAEIVMSKFVIDEPLADDLFSLDAPAGYKLETNEFALAELGKVAEEVAALLRVYTDKSENGAFPAKLDDWTDFFKVIGDEKGAGSKIGGISGILYSTSPDAYGYAGKGVRRGEKDKIVFWFRPGGSKTFRAVFGDLRVEDVTKDKLPSTRPAE